MPQIDNYYNRYSAAKNYEEILFRDGYGMQASEMNEWQSIENARITKLANALFADGDVISGGSIKVTQATGKVEAQAAEIFAAGRIWSVPAATFTIPKTGTVAVGIVIEEQVISEKEDPGLRNPAIGFATTGEAGAWRRKMSARWSYAQGSAAGNFYSVNIADDGQMRLKETPPALDSFNQALAMYDRDSTGGGSYVIEGLNLVFVSGGSGNQLFSLSQGRARVNGFGLELPTSRSVTNATVADLRKIDIEVADATSQAATSAGQKVMFAHPPVKNMTSLRITVEETFTIIHGAYLGCADDIPVTGVLTIVEVRQDSTVYAENTSWVKKGDQIDWSPGGPEPAPGSTITARVRYLKDYTAQSLTADSFVVKGAVPGTQIIYGYNQLLPRVDRLILNQDGTTSWKIGVAAERNPVAPHIPVSSLLLATVYQNWRANGQKIVNDSPRVYAFSTIAQMESRLSYALTEIARNRLEISAQGRESGAKTGMWVDPLLDDSMRDQGIAQTGAVSDGYLMLPMLNVGAKKPSADVKVQTLLPWTVKIGLEQPLITGEMQVNPYMAFDPFPALVTLDPAVDQWTETQTIWVSDQTSQMRLGSTDNATLMSTTSEIRYLRQIEVAFEISGFGPGERLTAATFDGRDILPQIGSRTANASGEITGSFTIPANVPAGAKLVSFTGAGGSYGNATFVGQGQLTVQTLRRAIIIWSNFWEPICQTFAFTRDFWFAGVDLWFTAKSTEVRVELRAVENGMPTRQVLATKRMPASSILTNGSPTRFLFDIPVFLEGNREYCFVVMCNDAVTKCSIAQLGKFDAIHQQWVTSQPYTVGLMMSSSNASTWTPHQDADLTFRILEATFTASSRVVSLGNVAVTNATDLLLNALYEIPHSVCAVDFTLTLPDGKSMVVAEGQPVNLGKKVSGNIAIKATLRGSAANSPVLYPDTQLMYGTCGDSGTYISRSIVSTGAIRAVLMYEAGIPSGSAVTPQIQIDSGAWVGMDAAGTTQGDEGVVEFTFQKTLSDSNLVKIRFTLAGTPAARPTVQNIRLLAVK